MIPLFFNRLPVTIESKLDLLFKKAKELYGSEYYNIDNGYWQNDLWRGDNLTVESLFPDWILNSYKNDSTKVNIVPIIKNYLRWLFSTKYGYGAYIEWETLRSPMFTDSFFLEAIAESYFPGEDFNSDELKDILPNIRKFSIQCDSNYFDKKGTAEAIKYVLITLLGLSYSSVTVETYSNSVIKIKANIPENKKAFLERSVFPAGMFIIYEDS
jgi:hypothetical protein